MHNLAPTKSAFMPDELSVDIHVFMSLPSMLECLPERYFRRGDSYSHPNGLALNGADGPANEISLLGASQVTMSGQPGSKRKWETLL